MYKLLAERLTGELQPHFVNEHTERGHEDEPKARAAYAFENDIVVEEVGFITNSNLNAGYSPDGIVGNDGLIEIKINS